MKIKRNFCGAMAFTLFVSALFLCIRPAFAEESNDEMSVSPTAVSDSVGTDSEISDLSTLQSAESEVDSGAVIQAPETVSAPAAEGAAEVEVERDQAFQGNALTLTSVAPPKNEVFDHRRSPVSEVEKNSGALTYAYPITLPPGRNGLQPDLNLIYRSQDAEEGSIFGSNWSLNIPFIERFAKRGVDLLYSTTTPSYFISSLDGELASSTASSAAYVARVENGDFNRYTFSNNQWLMVDKSGKRYKFGFATTGRQDDPSNTSHVFKWMLEEVRDTNDNYIKYTYVKSGGEIYPSSIIYTGNGSTDGIFEIDFFRENRPDAATSSRSGFPVYSSQRISRIDVKINGVLTRRYFLRYVTGDNGTRSLLKTLVESGTDESGGTVTQPTTTFAYQAQNQGWSSSSTWNPPVTFTESNYHDKGYRIVDVNGDGLPDLIWSYDFTPSGFFAYINNGHGWTADPSWNPPVTFVTQTYEDKGYKIIDVNGDGLPDIIRGVNGSPATFEAYINNGHGWTADSSWNPPVTFTESNYHDKGYRIVDVNGDGLPDLIWSYDFTPSGFFAYINNGHGWTADPSWNPPVTFVTTSYQDKGYEVLDVNGDGLPDIIRGVDGSPATLEAYINNGHGWTADVSWNPPVTLTESNYNDKGYKLLDVNGDGLPDLIWSYDFTPSGFFAYINNGHGWTADSSWNPPVTFVSSAYEEKGYKMTDVNANGLPDIIRGVNATTFEAYANNGRPQYLLSSVTSPQGGGESFDYLPVAQYLNAFGALANSSTRSLYAVNHIVRNDGFGTLATSTYRYEGGKEYYGGPFEKKFAGFATVFETDPQGNVVKTFYHQGNASDAAHGEYNDDYFKIGKPYRVERYDQSGNLFEKTIEKWDRTATSGTAAGFVKLVQSVVSTYDGDVTHKDKAETYAYDAMGNQTQEVEYGVVTGSDNGTFTDTGSDKVTRNILYASGASSDVRNAPYDVTTLNQGGAKVKESRYYYDSLSLGSVTKGNRTKEAGWKSGSTYINRQKTYNATYGVVATETDPRGKVTNYAYDGFNLYPATVTNAQGHAMRYLYDYSSGQSKQTTDPNGLMTQTVFDGLDRVVQQKQPDLTTSSTLVAVSAFVYTDTPNAVRIRETRYFGATSTVDTFFYFDGFGRLIQKRKKAEASNVYEVADTAYAPIGKIQKTSLPYFSSGSSRTAATTIPALYMTYAYDAVQRVRTTSNILGTTTSTYADWKTTVTDPNGKIKDMVYDAFGRLVEVDEHCSTSTYVTRYAYDAVGNLVKTTDALGSVRSFTYDGLGRRLTAQDLHTPADATFGTRSYAYDDAGNLVIATDAKGQAVRYTYDAINRLLSENAASTTGVEVTYVYDTCAFGVGSLCMATTTSATTSTYQYNPLHLVAQETRTIGGANYQTSYTYDRQGNRLTIVNPDNSQVAYAYNAAGLLERISKKETTDASFVPVVRNFDYGPTEQAALISFANGATTTNTFDAAKLYRLTRKVSTTPVAGTVQDISYAYDKVGNILTLTDNSQTNAKKTVTYVYDDLYRLTSASATGTPAGISGYVQTYVYNAIGNLMNRSDLGAYGYASGTAAYANPQAAVTVASSTLAYDQNGNLAVISTPAASSGWQVNGGVWQRRRAVTINHARVSGTANLSNFPVVFSDTNADFKTVANGGFVASSTGADIFFTAADGSTKLSHELENYAPSTGAVTAWIKIPSLATSTDTVLYMYYGNASSADQQNKTAVWDSSARGVWHLNGNFLDSTSNTNNGVNGGSTSMVGKLGSARGFNGTNQRATVPNSGTLQPSSGLTLSTWIKPGGAQIDWAKILWYGPAWAAPWGPYGFHFNGSSDTDTQFHLASTSTDYSVPAVTQLSSTTTWYYLVGTYDGSVMRYYINGSLQSSNPISIAIGNYDATNGLGIADIYQGTQLFNGGIDEIHIDRTARSGDWIQTSYNNQNATSTFMTLGTAQTNSGASSDLRSMNFTWDYLDRLIQATSTASTSTSLYAPSGERLRVTIQTPTSTATTVYPTKFYNISGGIPTKHLFAGDELIATISGSGSTSTVLTVLTDHLSGSNVVLSATGTVRELMDYYPYGNLRLDKQTGFNEQQKFIGQEYDADTGLSYLNARYLNGKMGRFVSQDPVFWEVGQTKDGKSVLTNPQALNSYAYANNNPITLSDPNGRVVETVLDVGFTAYDIGNTLYKGGQFIKSVFSGDLQKASNASNAFLGSFVDLGVDAGATLVPFLPAGLTKVDDAAKAVKSLQCGESLLSNSQRQAIGGIIQNSKLQNIFNKFYQSTDKLPGGTAGAIKFEMETGKLLSPSGHLQKGQEFVKGLNRLLQNGNLGRLEATVAQTLLKQLNKVIK